MKDIQFTLAARCEAAGRDNNEDNYQLIADIATDSANFTSDQVLTLGSKGTLLVVCDGMGGMNAGEVASAIAVKTIKECFTANLITKEVLADPEKYIVQSIQAADAAIKEEGKRNPETEGMGSTIVLTWLLNGKAYVGWCGDSRAYRYNPVTGLERLSHDHSYVQELVDAGSITEELAFFHPNNNIITRSLGDPRGTAQPDIKVFDIQENDLYLLCSDGLCGCLQDAQILAVLEQKHETLSQCRDALWKADEEAGWHDNVTTVLAQITKGGIVPQTKTLENTNEISASKAKLIRTNKMLKAALIGIGVLIVAGALAWVGYKYYPKVKGFIKDNGKDVAVVPDTITGSPSTDINTVEQAEPAEPEELKSGSATTSVSVPKPSNKSTSKIDSVAQKIKDEAARNATKEKKIAEERKEAKTGVKTAKMDAESTEKQEPTPADKTTEKKQSEKVVTVETTSTEEKKDTIKNK